MSDDLGFELLAETAPPAPYRVEAAPAVPYRVLARKYRPSRFDDLIGQAAMVQTLSNAFALNRIHQAYLLCGVRGVGKTTTARIMARALNYHRAAEGGQPAVDVPTIAMPALGSHCQAIIESRHVDVIEMDAASHTGIDDIRELIDGSRYRPVMARHKVYIIDEVHMLSKAAFNGLLKTLEEPPEHVKFLFATTEIDKVPVTIRSRCQRFDLRRIEAPVMIAHLMGICAAEGVAIEPEALALIARAAEGSVRDALSLLDQAIAHGAAGGGAAIDAAAVRLMLGLADRGRVIDLFEAVMRGDIATALGGLKGLHDEGADPAAILAALADFVHLVTRLKLVPDAAKDPALTGEERLRGQAFAAALGLPVLTRAWQMLSKGLAEIKDAPRALAAADMVLVRLAYAADLPTPDEAIRRLQSLSEAGGARPGLPPSGAPSGLRSLAPTGDARLARPAVGSGGQPTALRALPMVSQPMAGQPMAGQPMAGHPEPAAKLPRTIEDLVALALEHRDIQLRLALEADVRPVRLEPGSFEFEAMPGASPQLAGLLMRRLGEWTGQRWMVAVVAQGGAPTLRERGETLAQARRDELATDPLVAKILALFPGSRVTALDAGPEPEAEPPAPPEVPLPVLDGEVVYAVERPDDYGFDPDDL